jgi:RNA polymerase-associated protein LEO1
MEYKADSWEPSEWELLNAQSEKPCPEVLFRRDASTGKVQSNANIYRWSDGSVTIAIGDEHYEIQTKRLAPPLNQPYKEVQDAHYYVAAAHLTTNSLVVVGHFTEQYSVRPNKDITDDAVERLKAELASQKKDRGTDMIITTREDPELQKKQAELAERERARAQRKRENAAARLDGLGGLGGGSGGGRYKAGALSVGDLEAGRRGAQGGRKRGAPGAGKKKHRRPEYDSDDDLPSGARHHDDNYDMEDGFLVDSDDESDGVNDDDEEELLDDDDEEEEDRPRTKRQKTADAEDGEGDNKGGRDSDRPAERSGHGHRRRNVIDDDDDDE